MAYFCVCKSVPWRGKKTDNSNIAESACLRHFSIWSLCKTACWWLRLIQSVNLVKFHRRYRYSRFCSSSLVSFKSISVLHYTRFKAISGLSNELGRVSNITMDNLTPSHERSRWDGPFDQVWCLDVEQRLSYGPLDMTQNPYKCL